MQFPESLITLAGFVLAHAAWNVSDLPNGELLVPLAIVERSGHRQLLRFEADTQEKAIAEGKATLAAHEGDIDAWAFAREGQMQVGGKYVDVLTVEAKQKGSSTSIVFIQRFEPFASGKFKLLGAPTVAIGGDVLPRKVVSSTAAATILAQLQAGVQTHAKAVEHWQEWFAPGA